MSPKRVSVREEGEIKSFHVEGLKTQKERRGGYEKSGG